VTQELQLLPNDASLDTFRLTTHAQVPLDILGKTLIAPVRLIADRGGKSWRSYAALACVDAVGGDSRRFVQWVAMPEFLHVGSLIVDGTLTFSLL
jgi:geranylgeranyl pyrophosphate synthase